MFANTSEDEFDAVIAVHLKGHFATMKHAAAYWRAQSKAGDGGGRPHHQHQLGRRACKAVWDRPITAPPRRASPP